MKCETNKRAIFLSDCTYLLFEHFKFIKMLFLKAYKYFVQKMKSLSKSTNFQNVITITTLLVIERTGDTVCFIQG